MTPGQKGTLAWLATWWCLGFPATFLVPGWWFLIPMIPVFFAAQAMEAAVARYYTDKSKEVT